MLYENERESWYHKCEINHFAVFVFQIRKLCLAVREPWLPNVSYSTCCYSKIFLRSRNVRRAKIFKVFGLNTI